MKVFAKRILITSFLLACIFTLIPNIQTEAAVSGEFRIWAQDNGDYDGVKIWHHQGGNISAKIFQQGIHSGQQANTVWTLRTASGREISATYLPFDYNGTITFYSVAPGDYTLTWKSLTNNDTEGTYRVYSNGGSIFK
ncbi:MULTISPECIES: hypothetical protein [Robertmurraya]|uniref:Rhamnogalacturonan lyase domain-containing protein n=1 Tax=Robertmurraya beringensis TaxID=641660 RepID=A0ABV6KYL3_9BACI